MFFPAPSEPADVAVALCRSCEVQGACLAWALDVGDCHGVWGATTPRERRAMLVAWRGSDDGEGTMDSPLPVTAPVSATAEVSATETAAAAVSVGRLLGLVPEQRRPLSLGERHADRRRADGVLTERVAS